MRYQATLIVALLVALAGCSKQDAEPTAQSKDSAQNQTATPSKDLFPQESQMRPGGQGKVVTTQHAGGYSYVEVESNGGRFWVAGNRININPGDTVVWRDAAVMTNFKSKSLDRTFDQILFAGRLAQAGGGAVGTGAKVLDVAEGGGYTYLQVDIEGTPRWLAAPSTPVKAGDTVSWRGGSMMYNFDSKALNKKFEQILFVSGIQVQ